MTQSRFAVFLCIALAASPAIAVPIFASPDSINPAVFELPVGAHARLTLPGGAAFDVLVEPHKKHASGNVTWRGRITGVGRDGYVVMLTGGETTGVFGTLLTPQGEYRLSPAGGAWNEVAWAKTTPVASSLPDTYPGATRGTGPMTAVHKDHVTTTALNVLVRYTEGVRDGRNDAQWDAYLDNLFATTNEAFVQSGTKIELHLTGDQLTQLSATADNEASLGYLYAGGATEDWRYNLDAHFVTLLRPHDDAHGSCGAARLPVCADDAQCYNHEFGYSVVSVGPKCSGLMLAHQIGHNLGAAHEPVDPQRGTYPYAHAHLFDGTKGTVMAWSGAETLVAWFSDPAAIECGGEACGVENDSENARTLEQTRHYIARWLTDQSIDFINPPTDLTRDSSVGIEFDWFGILGTKFDIGLYRNESLVATFVTNESMPTGVKTIQVPSSLEAGSDYVLRVSSSNLPAVMAETAVSVNDPPPASLFSFAAARVTASGDSATLTVRRTGTTDGEVEVDYTTRGGSAHEGVNYTPVSGKLTWADGDTTDRTITISNLRAAESGNPISIFVVLENPSGGARLGSPALGEVVIPGKAGGGGGGALGTGSLVVLLSLLWLAARRPRHLLSVRCSGR